MAGYKNTCISDGAISFWSFDGDPFDPFTKLLDLPEGYPQTIIDEIDSLNPAYLVEDSEIYHAYKLGNTSLCVNEITDQYSLLLGSNEYAPELYPLRFPSAGLRIDHSITYSFPNNGSFSIEFIAKKNTETSFSQLYPHYACSRPFIIKKGVFRIELKWSTGLAATLYITHPGSTSPLTVPFYFFDDEFLTKFNLYEKTIHYVLTWKMDDLGFNQYTGTTNFYINGRNVATFTKNYDDIFPNTNVNNPFYVGIDPEGVALNSDRHCGYFYIDQIAVYQEALTSEQVSDHFTKIYPYIDVIKNEFAIYHWPMDDIETLENWICHEELATPPLDGLYPNNSSMIVRGLSGPPELVTSYSALFRNNGALSIIKRDYQNKITPVISNFSIYSFDFWFTATGDNIGVLFNIQNLSVPWNGPHVILNMRNGQYHEGGIQFSESLYGQKLNSLIEDDGGIPYQFNMGFWHYICFLRRPTGYLELWLDGKLHDSKYITPISNITDGGCLFMMNSLPGVLNVTGNLSHVAYYAHDLQASQIKAKWSYSTKYKIFGKITLLGIPYDATIRFYKSNSGEFVGETTSDLNTGEYLYYFPTNERIDMLVFDKKDITVRYRAYGPITPSTMEDVPIVL